MRRPFVLSLLLSLIVAVALTPRVQAQINEGASYGPLPVFEFHSGFWVNLHHTLYQEAKFRTSQNSSAPSGGDRDKTANKSRPSFRTPNSKIPFTPTEQRAW